MLPGKAGGEGPAVLADAEKDLHSSGLYARALWNKEKAAILAG